MCIMPKILKWLHFVKVDTKKTKCNICAKDVATKTRIQPVLDVLV